MQTVGQNSIQVKLFNEKNTEQLIKCQLILGQAIDSSSFHTITIPNTHFKSFQMFHLTNKANITLDTTNYANVSVFEKVDLEGVMSWIGKSFSYQNNPTQLVKTDAANGKMEIKAVNIRNG